MAFSDLTGRTQIARLRPVATKILERFGVEATGLRVINHAYNTTYAVQARSGARYALRLNTNSHRSLEEVNAEISWISALAAEFNESTDPGVPCFPAPQRSRSGPFIVTEFAPPLEREILSVLYSWLPGRSPNPRTYRTVARAMGAALRHMHRQAEHFQLPGGSSLKPLDNSLFNRPFELHKNAPDVDHAMLLQVAEDADVVMRREMAKPLRPVHYDLHSGNAKWHKGRLSVFDFDDCMLGRPILDAAVSLFYLRPLGPEVEKAFWAGFSGTKQRALEEHSITDLEFETLVASRAVALSNELFRMNTASLTKMAPKYTQVTKSRIEHFKRTGFYDPQVAKFP